MRTRNKHGPRINCHPFFKPHPWMVDIGYSEVQESPAKLNFKTLTLLKYAKPTSK